MRFEMNQTKRHYSEIISDPEAGLRWCLEQVGATNIDLDVVRNATSEQIDGLVVSIANQQIFRGANLGSSTDVKDYIQQGLEIGGADGYETASWFMKAFVACLEKLRGGQETEVEPELEKALPTVRFYEMDFGVDGGYVTASVISQEFWKAWRSGKRTMKNLGWVVDQDSSGDWRVWISIKNAGKIPALAKRISAAKA